MKREDKFVMSHRPYAVGLGSLRTRFNPTKYGGFWDCQVEAVWFRRRKGVTMACIGTLWDYQDVEPVTTEQFLQAHDDGRYGGTTVGRWDGEGYWGNVSLDEQNEHLSILRPMLEDFPAVPKGHDGWWTFR